MDWELALALASGIAIAAACGLRAFLPLFVLGMAGRLGIVELHSAAAWLASTPALVGLGVATVLELAADKVPVIDHALDLVASVLRPAAAWLGAYVMLADWPSPWGQLLAVTLGGGAFILHAAKAKVRLGSSATTLGLGNPVLSAIEDVVTVAFLAIAILAPLLVVVGLALLVTWLVRRGSRAEVPRAGT